MVTVMTVVLGCPLNLYGTVNGAAFPRSRRRRGAGRKPCIKGVQRESLAHAPCLQGVVCYTLQKRAVKTGAVFSAAGVALRAEGGEKNPRLHGAFAGCSPAGWQGAERKSIVIAATPATRRARLSDFTLLWFQCQRQGVSRHRRHHRHHCHPPAL